MRRLRNVAAILAVVSMFFFQVSTCAAKDAVTFQIDVGHTGRGVVDNFGGSLKVLWSRNLGGDVSYPLITKKRVYVTVAGYYQAGTWLYALNRSTGRVEWQQAISGTYTWSNAAYDGGQVFVLNSEAQVTAYNADTGALNWSVLLRGQLDASAAPVAHNGLVYVDAYESGTTLYALDEMTGTTRWAQTTDAGSSSPAVSTDSVYASYPCEYYSFAAKTGLVNWADLEGCDGGGGETPVLFNASLYIRDPGPAGYILNPKTGAIKGNFNSQLPPAFFVSNHETYGVAYTNGTLTCFNAASGATQWTFNGDGQLTTAPLDVSGYIIEGSGSGNLYVLDETTGQSVSTTSLGLPIPEPNEEGLWDPLTGLGAGNGVVIVPAGSVLFALGPG